MRKEEARYIRGMPATDALPHDDAPSWYALRHHGAANFATHHHVDPYTPHIARGYVQCPSLIVVCLYDLRYSSVECCGPSHTSTSLDCIIMATAEVALPTEPTTLYYYLEPKDGGIIQTYPGTAFEKRRKHVPHEMHVRDMRPVRSEFKIDTTGFELVENVSKEKDFTNDAQVEEVYYPEVIDMIKRTQVPRSTNCSCTRLTCDDEQDGSRSCPRHIAYVSTRYAYRVTGSCGG